MKKVVNGLQKLSYLNELRILASKDPRYAKLAQVAASNLGQPNETLEVALESLENMIWETEDQDGGGEEGVMKEVNFVRDLVPK